MKKLVLAITTLAFCSLCWGQAPSAGNATSTRESVMAFAQKNAAQAAPHSPLATSACSFTFTFGANDSLLKYCVTANGNITQLETPQGHEHIAVGAAGEGYGICDLIPFVTYSDYGDFGDSGNWNPSSVISQSAKSVKIARTTSDGIWTLTQTISQVAGISPSIKIVMTLKNNSDQLRSVFLVRYADVDADRAVQNNFDGTAKSAFGWNSNASSKPFGLILQNAGPFPFATEPAGFTQTVPNGPDPCRFVDHFANGTQTGIDGSVVLLYPLNFSKGASKTVTVSYKGL